MSDDIAGRRPGIRACFCDLRGRPGDDWDAHEGFCLMLDWAAAHGKITPAYFQARVEGSITDLGLTEEELASPDPSQMPQYPAWTPFRHRQEDA